MADIKIKIKKKDGTDLILNEAWIDDLSTKSQITSDPSSIQYGLLGNAGSLKLRDIDGTLKNYISKNVIDVSNVPIQIIVNNNLIQSHISIDSDYNTQDMFLNIQLSNELYNWDNMNIDGINLQKERNAYSLLEDTLKRLNYTLEDINLMFDSELKQYLTSIIIPYPYVENKSYREAINLFCNLAQINSFEDKNGNLKFVSARPITSNFTNAINIPMHDIYSNLSQNLFIKNQHKNVAVDYAAINTRNSNTVYNSKTLQAYNAQGTYIGENEGVNPTEYNVEYDTTSGEFPMQRITAELDISKYEFAYIRSKTNYETIYKVNWDYYTRKQGTEEWTKVEQSSTQEFKFYNSVIYDYFEPTVLDFMEEYDNTKTYRLNNFVKYNNKPYRFKANTSISGHPPTETNYWEEKNIDKIYLSQSIPIFEFDTAVPVGGTQNGRKVTSYEFSIRAKEAITYDINTKQFGQNITYTNPFSYLIQTDTRIGDSKIVDIIANNIISDYSNGVASAKIDIFCDDYFDLNNKKVIDWDNGEIIDVCNIVYFDDDLYTDGTQRYWKVTGREFKYNGAPTISLELQECILPSHILTYTNSGEKTSLVVKRISGTGELGTLESGARIYDGDVIEATANYLGTSSDAYLVIKENSYENMKQGKTYTKQFTVSGNINLDCYAYVWKELGTLSNNLEYVVGESKSQVNTITGIDPTKELKVISGDMSITGYNQVTGNVENYFIDNVSQYMQSSQDESGHIGQIFELNNYMPNIFPDGLNIKVYPTGENEVTRIIYVENSRTYPSASGASWKIAQLLKE